MFVHVNIENRLIDFNDNLLMCITRPILKDRLDFCCYETLYAIGDPLVETGYLKIRSARAASKIECVINLF